MRLFATHFWREWRAHRMVLLGLLALTPAFGLVLRFIGGTSASSDEWLTIWCTILATITVLFAIVADLFPRERQGSGERLLLRLPRARNQAFWAKLVFGVLALIGAPLYAWGMGNLLGGEGFEVLSKSGLTRQKIHITWIAVTLLWCIPTATWMRTSASVFPAAFCFLFVALLPLSIDGSQVYLSNIDHNPLLYRALLVLAPIGVAWFCFVGGRWRGRSRAFAVTTSVGLALCSFTPAWAFSPEAPHSTHWNIGAVHFSPELRKAYVNLVGRNRTGSHSRSHAGRWAWKHDLESGKSLPAGARERSQWERVPYPYHSLSAAPRASVLELVERRDTPEHVGDHYVYGFYGSIALRIRGPRPEDSSSDVITSRFIDCESGKELFESPHERVAQVRLSDLESLVDLDAYSEGNFSRAGLGYQWQLDKRQRQDEVRWIDPLRDLELTTREVMSATGARDFFEVTMSRHGWLAKSRNEPLWIDWERKTATSPTWLRGRENGFLEDGTLLFARLQGNGNWYQLTRVDPRTGEEAVIADAGSKRDYRVQYHFLHAGAIPADRRSFVLTNSATNNHSCLLLFDPTTNELLELGTYEHVERRFIAQIDSKLYYIKNGTGLGSMDADTLKESIVFDIGEWVPTE